MTVSATTDSSSPITAASRIRPGQRSSALKYGLAIRQTVASVEKIPLTTDLLVGQPRFQRPATRTVGSSVATAHGHDAMAAPNCTTRDEKRAGIKAKRLFESIHKVIDLDESLAPSKSQGGHNPIRLRGKFALEI
jgi:hypothetical protein